MGVIVAPGHIGSTVAYLMACADLWQADPELLDYVRRFRNTHEVGGWAGGRPASRLSAAAYARHSQTPSTVQICLYR